MSRDVTWFIKSLVITPVACRHLFVSILINFISYAVLPKITSFDFGEDAIFSGQSAQASCFVSEGTEPVRITWNFQGKQITSDNKDVTVTRVGKKASILVIDPARSHHRGNYTCSARNDAGTSNFTAVLNINGTHLCYISHR